jgi:hypothetical protein
MRGWASDVLTDPLTVIAGILLFVLAAVSSRPVARRLGTPIWVSAGLLASAAAVVMLTLLPAPGFSVAGPSGDALGACAGSLGDPAGLWRGLVARDSIGERVGNILMFVPLTFFTAISVARRRVALVAALGSTRSFKRSSGRPGHGLIAVAAAAVATPVVIEVVQALLGAGRTCAGYDWVNNALGGLLGVAVGAVVLGRIRQNER